MKIISKCFLISSLSLIVFAENGNKDSDNSSFVKVHDPKVGSLDIVLMLDESDAVKHANFKPLLETLHNWIKQFDVGALDSQSKFGIVHCNEKAKVGLYLHDLQETGNVLNEIALPAKFGGENTTALLIDCFNITYNNLFSLEQNARREHNANYAFYISACQPFQLNNSTRKSIENLMERATLLVICAESLADGWGRKHKKYESFKSLFGIAIYEPNLHEFSNNASFWEFLNKKVQTRTLSGCTYETDHLSCYFSKEKQQCERQLVYIINNLEQTLAKLCPLNTTEKCPEDECACEKQPWIADGECTPCENITGSQRYLRNISHNTDCAFEKIENCSCTLTTTIKTTLLNNTTTTETPLSQNTTDTSIIVTTLSKLVTTTPTTITFTTPPTPTATSSTSASTPTTLTTSASSSPSTPTSSPTSSTSTTSSSTSTSTPAPAPSTKTTSSSTSTSTTTASPTPLTTTTSSSTESTTSATTSTTTTPTVTTTPTSTSISTTSTSTPTASASMVLNSTSSSATIYTKRGANSTNGSPNFQMICNNCVINGNVIVNGNAQIFKCECAADKSSTCPCSSENSSAKGRLIAQKRNAATTHRPN